MVFGVFLLLFMYMLQGNVHIYAFSVDMLWGKCNRSFSTNCKGISANFFETIDYEDRWRGENQYQCGCFSFKIPKLVNLTNRCG